MAVVGVSSPAVLAPVGGLWVLEVLAVDLDGTPVDAAPTVTITMPAGTTSTPTVETVEAGRYRVAYTLATAGRYVAAAATADDVARFAAYATGPTTAAGMPAVDDVADYLREGAASWTTEDLQGALDAEAAAQRAVCRVGAVYPADMREALLRRVQRNLALRGLPLAITDPDTEGGVAVLPGRDPEVRRLEAPYRRWVIG